MVRALQKGNSFLKKILFIIDQSRNEELCVQQRSMWPFSRSIIKFMAHELAKREFLRLKNLA